MDRKFSKDISSYKKDIWKGFSKEELIVIIIALVIGGTATYVAVRYLNMSFENAVYTASLVGVPVIYLFFKKEKDIPLIKVLLRKRQLKKTSGKFDYKSSEMQIFKMEELSRKRMADEEKRIKKKRRII